MTTTVPTPAIFAGRKQAVVPSAPQRPARIAATINTAEPGTIVRPGLVDEVIEEIHDGVIKTKNLEKGQRVRPFVHGEARGGERIVERTERLQGGAIVRVTWASKHAPSEHKAAYRWFDESLVGVIVEKVVQKPGFVSYQEA
jgi:hypothetical protein